jgi:hypothetical protein
MFYQRVFKTTHGVDRSGKKTRFEYLWKDKTEMKSKEPGEEPVQLP